MKITKDNFESEVVNSSLPVLLDFWATWCGPCRMIAPALEEVEKEYEGKIIFGKTDVDEEPELASSFGISSIPTLVFIKNGVVADISVGYKTKDEIISFIEKNK